MNQISLLLKKYENLGFKESDLKKKIIEIVQKETGVELKKDDIKIFDMNATLKVSGAAKAELFLKRRKIEEQINDIKNIR
jgi:hypothetical protein